MTDIIDYVEPTSKLDRAWLKSVFTNPEYGCKDLGNGIIRLPIARLAFANLIEQKKNVDPKTQVATYEWGADFVFPPELTKDYFKAFLNEVHAKALEKHGPDYVKMPKFFHPLKEQNLQLSKKGERWAGYADRGYVVGARDAKNPPQITDIHNNVIDDVAKVKSGYWGFPLVSVFAFSASGNYGVSCGLRGFILVAQDNVLGGSVLDTEKAVAGLAGLAPPPGGVSFDEPDEDASKYLQ